MRRVTATEANRQFSSLLRDVAAGETIIVTSHGRAVATLTPARAMLEEDEQQRRQQVWDEIFARTRGQKALDLPRESRQDIYENDR